MSNRWQRRTGPYKEILRAIWNNKDRPGYAWRILNDGVCDGCALGTSGMRDWTMDGVHLCWLRLNLLRLNTMPEADPARLADVSRLRDASEQDLRSLGRLPCPLVRRKGDRGFKRLSWDDAMDLMVSRIGAMDPRRLAFYVVSRGTVNETYYAMQKAARALGTNHIDNSARVCHSPSTTGLKKTLGFAATTLSYRDLLESDLVVFIGSNAANNQPVMMKYLHMAKERGTRVAVVNPFREPGMETYWVPSSVKSALFGTKISDAFFPVRVGGDIAFLNGVLKVLIERNRIDRDFIVEHTEGWEELERTLAGQSFADLEAGSGASRASMEKFANLYAEARTAVFVWSMGITMHRHGVQNVQAIVNTALARGMVGKPGTGLMPIRGHSGVQGGSEMGCIPNQFPGGHATDAEGAAALGARWGFPVPDWTGHTVTRALEAAARGELDGLYCVGSNLLGILPDPEASREAIRKVPFRVHHDIVVNPQMLVEPSDTVLLLPATTRYEMVGGGTETSTERRVILNPEIPGPRVAEARDEWRVAMELARRVRPEHAARLGTETTAELRQEIAEVIPQYDGIQHLQKKGDQFQWGGARLGEDNRFPVPGGRARFSALTPPDNAVPAGKYRLTTRRGKQFNSMVFAEKDMATGTERETVVLAGADMETLKLRAGDPVEVRSATGAFRGLAHEGPVQPGTVMLTWPEANVLLPQGVEDPQSGIPAYRDTVVEVVPVRSS